MKHVVNRRGKNRDAQEKTACKFMVFVAEPSFVSRTRVGAKPDNNVYFPLC